MAKPGPDDLADIAAALGLEKAYRLDPQAFGEAMDKARALAGRIARPASVADEPAHVFRLPGRGDDGPAGDTEGT